MWIFTCYNSINKIKRYQSKIYELHVRVVDCPDPEFNTTFTEFGDDPKNSYGSSFRVFCKEGYYFAQQEFQDCGKYIVIIVLPEVPDITRVQSISQSSF